LPFSENAKKNVSKNYGLMNFKKRLSPQESSSAVDNECSKGSTCSGREYFNWTSGSYHSDSMSVEQTLNKSYTSVGRHKSAKAIVTLRAGKGDIKINRRSLETYLQFNPCYISDVKAPLKFFRRREEYDILVTASGGGLGAQSKATRLAISRNIVAFANSSVYKKALKHLGYLTQDSRSKERKKYGLRKARKAPQFSKR